MSTKISLLSKPIFIDSGSSLISRLAHGAAYHTSEAMNQNIAGGTQDRTGHAQGKSDIQPRLERPIQVKKHTACRDIAGDGGKLSLIGRKNHRKRKGKSDGAAHFLP